MFRTRLAAACMAAFASAAGNAMAADSARYPSRPIRLIVPFAPGGSADALARTIQPALSEALGQTLVIDNRPGGSGTIGTDMTAKAVPDGYTLLLITTTHTVNPSLMTKLPFDTVKDFAAVSLIVSQSNILAVHPSVPVKSVRELVALAKSKPNTLNFASGGNGSSPHLSGELLKLVAGIQITHIPYKGSGPGVTDLLGGHVQMMFVGPLAIEQHIKNGRLRALAIAATRRSSVLPDVPTMSEAGFAGVETGTWYGLLAPARTPRAIVTQIHGAIVRVLQTPDTKSRLVSQGVDIVGSSPDEFEKFIIAEVAKWSKVVQQAGIRPG
ncbi:MAG: tripartite tricarboxylate transporter substrate binding protein [Betaproteobacteria bacterium]|nr:tripartite tricarboxylate transporter substrate binding protein [Betaproteobacteria bacterium]